MVAILTFESVTIYCPILQEWCAALLFFVVFLRWCCKRWWVGSLRTALAANRRHLVDFLLLSVLSGTIFFPLLHFFLLGLGLAFSLLQFYTTRFHLSARPMFLAIFETSVPSETSNVDTTRHWAAVIGDDLLHSVGAPIVGKGEVRYSKYSDFCKRHPEIRITRYGVGRGSILFRMILSKSWDEIVKLETKALIQSGVSCQEHAQLFLVSCASSPILTTLLILLRSLRWKHFFFVSVLTLVFLRTMGWMALYFSILLVTYDDLAFVMYYTANDIGRSFFSLNMPSGFWETDDTGNAQFIIPMGAGIPIQRCRH